MSAELSQPVTVERVKPRPVHTHYQIGSGFWVFLSVCIVCLTVFYILVGMGLVHMDLIRAFR